MNTKRLVKAIDELKAALHEVKPTKDTEPTTTTGELSDCENVAILMATLNAWYVANCPGV